MAVVLDTTVGGAAANSYDTLAEINTYAETTAWAASWVALADADRGVLAVRATRALDTLRFPGYPTSATQALQFPRADTYHPDGTAWADDAIPAPVKNAQAHIAAYLSSFAATADPFTVSARATVKRETVDVLTTEYFSDTGTDGALFLATVVAPMLRAQGLLGAAGVARLVR